jgi:hypothetical protein
MPEETCNKMLSVKNEELSQCQRFYMDWIVDGYKVVQGKMKVRGLKEVGSSSDYQSRDSGGYLKRKK